MRQWAWVCGGVLLLAAGARAQQALPPELTEIYAAEREAALRGDADALHAFTLREATFTDPSRVQTEPENLVSDREVFSRYRVLSFEPTPTAFEQAGPDDASVTLDSAMDLASPPRTEAQRRALARAGKELLSVHMTFTVVDRWRRTDAGWRRIAQTTTPTSMAIDPALREALESSEPEQ